MKNIYLLHRLSVVFLFALYTYTCSATAYSWGSTTTGGPWVTCTNWTGSACPVSSAANTVSFSPTTTITINNTAPAATYTLGTFTAGGTGTTALSFSTGITFTTLLVCNGNLTLGGGGGAVNFTLSSGASSIASGKTLTIGSGCTVTVASGSTLTVAGTISNSGSLIIQSGGTVNFTGSSVAAPSNVTTNAGGIIEFTGSGGVTGLTSSTCSGTLIFGGSTSSASGFVGAWGSGSTLTYQGTSAQTAYYRELPSSNGPTNLTINNASGVTMDATFGCTPVITGTLTLTTGALNMGATGYNTITFETGNTPIARTSGTLVVNLQNTLIFGASGALGGNAFTIPNGTFGTANVGGIQIQRTNSITLPTDNITLIGSTTPYALNLISGTLTLNTTSTTTLTISGTLPTSGTTGTITGSTTSNLAITGSGALGGALTFTSGSQNLNNFTINRSTSGTVSLGSALTAVTLTLDQGLLSLGTGQDLIVGTLAGNSPSATNMVVTSSTSGYLVHTFATGASSFTFPIGETVGTTEYSGFSFSFAANSISHNQGFKVVDANGPSLGSPTDYISRYWEGESNNNTGTYTWSASFPYNGSTGDINGTEGNMLPAWSLGSGTWTAIGGGSTNTTTHVLAVSGGTNTTAPLANATYITGTDVNCPSPTAPQSITVSSLSVGSSPVTISGTANMGNGTSNVSGIIIFANTSNVNAAPVAGTTYTVGQVLASGSIVIFVGGTVGASIPWSYNSTAQGGTALSPNTMYYLNFYSYSSGSCNLSYSGTWGFSSLAPNISVSASSVETCTGSQTVTPAFTTSGAPNQYNIIWNAAALSAGFVNVPSGASGCSGPWVTLPATPLSITVPANVTPGTYTGYIDPYNSTTGWDNCTYNGAGQANDPTVTITVTALVQGSLTANGPFCGSGAGTLTWTASSGTGPYTVVYNDGVANRTANSVTSGTPFAVFTTPVTATTTYTLVSVTDATCMRSSGFTGGSATITVNTQPNLATISNPTICSGSSINLTTLNPTDLAGTSGGTYVWSATQGGSALGSTTVSPTVNTTYWVRYTINSCFSDASVTVVVDKPTLTSSIGTSPTCTNAPNSGSIAWAGSGGTTPYSISTDAGSTYPNTYGAGVTSGSVSGLAAGTYHVEIKDNLNCTYAWPSALTLSAATSNPATITSVNYNGPVCQGTPIVLSAVMNNGDTYMWTGPGTTGNSGQIYRQNFDFLPSSGTSATWSTSAPPDWSATSNITTMYISSGSGANVLGAYDLGVVDGSNPVTNRALGLVAKNAVASLGLRINNKTGGPVDKVFVSYIGEQWTDAGNTAQSLAFYYDTTTNSLANLTSSANYTQVAALNFNTPVNSTSGVLDGHLAANQHQLSATITLNPPLSATGFIMLTWTAASSTTPDAMAIDSLTAILYNSASPLAPAPYTTATQPTLGATYSATGYITGDTYTIPGSSVTTAYSGTYTLSDFATAINGCAPATLTENVVVEVPPSLATIPAQTLCTGQSINLTTINPADVNNTTNSNNYVWSATQGGSALSSTTVSPGVGNTTYWVRYTNACGFTDKSVVVTVIGLPTASLPGSHGTTPVCSDNVSYVIPSGASVTNQSSYSWATSGTGSLSNTGTLTPTYTFGTGETGNVTITLTAHPTSPCSGDVSDYVIINIQAAPTASLPGSHGTTGVCLSGTSYTIPSGGSVSNQSSYGWATSGTGSLSNTTTLTPTYTFGTGETGNVTLTLTANAISPCSTPATDYVIINVQQPNIYNITGGTNCGSTTVGIDNTDPGVSYQLYNGATPVGSPVTGVGFGRTFGLQTATGTYTAIATVNSTGCTANMNGSAIVNPNPNVYAVGGGTNCTSTDVTLSNSDNGINYQLYNGVATVGTAKPGTGSSLDYGVQTANGNYTVVATDATTGCTSNMSGSATVNPTPSVYNVTGGTNCGSTTVGIDNSEPGVSYQLFNGASPVGSPATGVGFAYTFGSETAAGVYTVFATATATGCTANMSGSATVYANPNVYTVGGGTNCGSSDVTLSNTDVGINYQLYNGASTVGPVLSGTGSSHDFGTQTTPGTYTVTATDPSTGCSLSMSGSSVVNAQFTPAVSIAITIGAQSICPGTSVQFTATPTNGGTSPNYEWQLNGATVQNGGSNLYTNNVLNNGDQVDVILTSMLNCPLPATATSNTITMTVNPQPVFTANATDASCNGQTDGKITVNVSVGSAPFSYSLDGGSTYPYTTSPITGLSPNTYVVAVEDNNGCISAGTGTVVVGQPATLIAGASNSGPYATTQTIQLFASQSGGTGPYTYSWYDGATFISTAQNPTIANATTGMSGTYDVTVTDANLCTAIASTDVVVTTSSIYTWTGTTSNDWTIPSNWSPPSPAGGPNSCAADVVIPVTATAPTLATAASVGNMQINSGATLTLTSTLSVCKNWTGGSGTKGTVAGAGIIILNGSILQLIDGYTQFNELKLSNSNGASILSSAVVDVFNALDLQAGTLNATNGSLNLLSTTVTQIAIIDNFSAGYSGTISGNVNAQRYFNASSTFNQHFMGSPVNQPALSQFGVSGNAGYVVPKINCDETQMSSGSPYGSVFSYHESAPNAHICGEAQWKVETSGSAANGQGYSILKAGGGTLTLSGAPNLSTSYTVPGLTNSGWSNVSLQTRNMSSGWQLLSNPYSATLQLTTSNAGFDNQVQVWNANGPFAGTYQVGTVGTDAIIAPFQAFMVHKTSVGGTANYTIYASDRVRTPQTFYAQNDNQLDIVAENISTGLLDQTTIAFNSHATDGFDEQYDADKFGGSLTRHTLYSLNQNKWMARNVLNSVSTTAIVAVGFEPGKSGNYSFSFNNLNTFDPTTYIYLEDKQTGAMFNVRSGNYQFSADSADEWNRFVLHFTPAAIINSTAAGCNELGNIHVIQAGNANWNYTVTDDNNMTISSGILNQNNPLDLNAAAGNYNLMLVDNNGYTVTKAIAVSGPPVLKAGFDLPSSVNVQTAVTFTNTSVNGVSAEWSLSNGVTLAGTNPVYTFTEPGTYEVRLTVTGATGCVAIAQKTITVNAVTGLKNLETGNDISMWSYENRIYVDFTRVEKVDATIKVYDILGREICTDRYVSNTVYQKTIDNLDAAYVIVSVKNEDNIITRKLFITNAR